MARASMEVTSEWHDSPRAAMFGRGVACSMTFYHKTTIGRLLPERLISPRI